MLGAARLGIASALSELFGVINGGVDYSKSPAEPVKAGRLAISYAKLCSAFEEAENPAVLEKILAADFSDDFESMLADLMDALCESSQEILKSVAGLTEAEKQSVTDSPESFFFSDLKRFRFLTAPPHGPLKILPITWKVDFPRMYAGALLAARAVDQFKESLRKGETGGKFLFFRSGAPHTGTLLDIVTPLGRIVINGIGNDHFQGEAAMVVDIGGNDRYTGPVASGIQTPGRVSILLDLAGNDTYDNGKNPFSQGFGCLSAGVLADLSGNDRYISGDMSQGAGLYGVGILTDDQGNDSYLMGIIGQGFGLFGAGYLLDLSGSDLYRIGGMGQGAGSSMGIGALCDLSGSDKYLSDRLRSNGRLIPDRWSHVQGAGMSIRSPDWVRNLSFYGGVGFLNDAQGDDFYYASDGNCMGGGYFMSVGALVDHAGNDRYMPNHMNGMGWAVHLANGILIDRKGDDYYAGSHSGGFGSDQSTGILADHSGNDLYGPSDAFVRKQKEDKAVDQHLADFSYGVSVKPDGLGILMDLTGNDRYYARTDGYGESIGGVVPPESPDKWGHGLLVDLSGDDRYGGSNRDNNKYHLYAGHGLCYDTEFTGNPFSAKFLPEPIEPLANDEPEPVSLKNDEHGELSDPDLFIRHAALGKLIAADPAPWAQTIKLLSVSRDNERNKDLMQVLDFLIIRNRHVSKIELTNLLGAPDLLVRRYAARRLGWWGVENAFSALKAALKDAPAEVRPDFIWAVGQLRSKSALECLVNIFENDADLSCRKVAIHAIASDVRGEITSDVPEKFLRKVFFKGIADKNESIRTDAASFGFRLENDPRIKAALEERLQHDPSVYVVRAAAKSLCEMGAKGGIKVLIETLAYPSVDTRDYYDHDLIKMLAFYCGTDFGPEERYKPEVWRRWWQKNQSSIDLGKNLAVRDRILSAFAADQEEKGIDIFEDLIKTHPKNKMIQNRYERFCREWVHYRLLTRAELTLPVLQRVIRLQKILVRLSPSEVKEKRNLAYYESLLQQAAGGSD